MPEVIVVKGKEARAIMLAIGLLFKMAGYVEGDDVIRELLRHGEERDE
jgi:hypothetical protein